jgi:hypothetical protein
MGDMTMTRILAAAAALSIAISGLAAPAYAANQCRDSKGKFIKCPTEPAATGTRCKDAKGRFTKCGTPGATPVK